jgi:hypothetical protein
MATKHSTNNDWTQLDWQYVGSTAARLSGVLTNSCGMKCSILQCFFVQSDCEVCDPTLNKDLLYVMHDGSRSKKRIQLLVLIAHFLGLKTWFNINKCLPVSIWKASVISYHTNCHRLYLPCLRMKKCWQNKQVLQQERQEIALFHKICFSHFKILIQKGTSQDSNPIICTFTENNTKNSCKMNPYWRQTHLPSMWWEIRSEPNALSTAHNKTQKNVHSWLS